MNLTDSTDNSTIASQLDASITAVATAADTQSAAGVTTLGLVQQARLSSQNRAVTAATSFYGATSTQASAAGKTVAATQAASSRISVLSDTVNTPAPTVAATGWALHGRVYDSSLAPTESYTVFLVDGQKNYLDEYGFSYTDATGYFLINYPGPTSSGGTSNDPTPQDPSASPGSQPASGSSSASQTASQTGSPASVATTDSSATDGSQIYMQIADASANPVLLSETAFAPTTGQATYQVVALPASGAKLGDPPAAIRAVALPPAKTQPKGSSGKASQKTK